jgi:hypothetical protein
MNVFMTECAKIVTRIVRQSYKIWGRLKKKIFLNPHIQRVTAPESASQPPYLLPTQFCRTTGHLSLALENQFQRH